MDLTVTEWAKVFLTILLNSLETVMLAKSGSGKLDKKIFALLTLSSSGFAMILYLFIGKNAFIYFFPLYIQCVIFVFLKFVFKFKFSLAISIVFIEYMCSTIAEWFDRIALSFLDENAQGWRILIYIAGMGITVFYIRCFMTRKFCSFCDVAVKSLYGINFVIPIVCYAFNYITTVRPELLLSGNYLIVQFMPFMVCVSYVTFCDLHTRERRKVRKMYDEEHALENKMKFTEVQFKEMREREQQARIYRHDMRHHFAYLASLADAGKLDELISYAEENLENINSITPREEELRRKAAARKLENM